MWKAEGQRPTVALKRKFNSSEPGIWVSSISHVALLVAGVVAYSAPTFPEAEEGIPVEVITDNQFSQITKGETDAKQVQPTPKPRVDRVADKAEQRDPGEDKRDAPAPPKRPAELKVAEAEEAAAATPPPPPPPPPPARAEAKPQPTPEDQIKLVEAEQAEALARQKAAEAKAKAEAEAKARAAEEARIRKAEAEAKAKAAAEAKAKAEAEAKAKAEAKKIADAKAKAEAEAKARKEAQLAKKLDFGDLKQFLDSKDRNQSTGSSGSEINRTASLGTQTGTAAKLNPSQRDALMGWFREEISRCYTAPISASAGDVTEPILDIRLNQDGSLSAAPSVLRTGSSAIDRAVADAALRAVRRCAPYRVPAQFAPYYSDWKILNVQFDLS
jgi:colicin import membrane protein